MRDNWVVRGKDQWRPWWLIAAGWDFDNALHQHSLPWALLMVVLGLFMLLPAGYGK